jgi:hypothetical protein
MPWHLIDRQLAGSAAATFPTTYVARPDLQGWSQLMAATTEGERPEAVTGRPPVQAVGEAGADVGRVPGQSPMT